MGKDAENPFFSRLKQALDGKTLKRIAADLDINFQNVQRYLGGRYPGTLFLMRLASVYEVNINWLLTGKGEMLITEEWKDAETGFYEDAAKIFETAVGKYKMPLPFPVVSHASANPHGTIDWEPVDHEYVEVPPHAQLVRVEDDSMSPTTLPGQFVWIDREAVIRNNDLVVAKVKGHPGFVFKRISHDKATDTVALSSVNQAVPLEPIIVRRDLVKEVYLVIGSWYLGKRRPGRIIKFE